jgi:hypothetical protein
MRRLIGAALAVLAAAGCAGERRAAPRRSKVEIRLGLQKDHFTAAESILLHVELRNGTGAPAAVPNPLDNANWQPEYTLSGPQYPEGFRFSARSAVAGPSAAPVEGAELELMTLAPGAVAEADLFLDKMARLHEPGVYQLRARLEWKGMVAESEPVSFRLEGLRVDGGSIGVDAGAAAGDQLWLAWLNRGGGAPSLQAGTFRLGGISANAYTAGPVADLGRVGADAADALSPWANFDRMERLLVWRAWREGAAILARQGAGGEPRRIDAGAPLRGLVRPALMTDAGALDVFALAEGSPALLLARFEKQGGARVLWETALPAMPMGARCAMGPARAGETRSVVLTAAQRDSILVAHVAAGDGSRAGEPQALRIPNAAPLGECDPGVHVDGEGRTHASLLLMRDGRLAIADLVFGTNGRLESGPKVTDIGELPGPAAAGAVAYLADPNEPVQRHWMVLLASGEIVSSAGGVSRPIRLPAAPAWPLELVSLPTGGVLLAIHPQAGPMLAKVW